LIAPKCGAEVATADFDPVQVKAMAAVARPGPKELLPEKLQARESPNDRRKLSDSIFEGPFQAGK